MKRHKCPQCGSHTRKDNKDRTFTCTRCGAKGFRTDMMNELRCQPGKGERCMTCGTRTTLVIGEENKFVTARLRLCTNCRFAYVHSV